MPTAASRPLTWLTRAGSALAPMGIQHYELQLLQALSSAEQSAWEFRRRTVTSLRGTGGDVRLPAGLLARGPDLLARALGRWACRGAEQVHRFDLRLPPAPGPEVVTVHDLPPLRFDDEGGLPPWAAASARRARLVICPSSFAASEAAELLGVTAVVVVPNGVSEVFRSPPPPERTAWLPPAYLLHAGGVTQRKNLPSLADAWRACAGSLPGVSLVLAGPPDARRASAFAGCPRVVQTGYLTPPDIASLMAGALAVVVPSTYEGFGLPALEAMAAGAPVVAARRGALPEVCADAALLVEPTAPALADALMAVCTDERLRAELRTRGRRRSAQFPWEATAAGHLRAYEAAFG